MLFYSTNKKSKPVSLATAVLKGLADDNGLFMPERIPQLHRDFFEQIYTYSLPETGFRVAKAMLEDVVPEDVLKNITYETLNFDIPLVQIDKNVFVLELFHGPTMAFKDVGARFMSRLMSWLLRNETDKLKVVVATSGDTGSAVASGFFEVSGIDVFVLFPKGKVSPLQQKQITTWGHNIYAIEIDGTFDDCQKLAKEILADGQLNEKFRITSANSINIARLIPQSFYYFWAAAQLGKSDYPLVFSVPSGNFGNLTAGLLAAAMGLKVDRFVAATNCNDIVPVYYKTGNYSPRSSIQTISNAMDVGNPSNYARIMDLFLGSHPEFCKNIYACSFTDDQTRNAIGHILKNHDYLTDPHGAVAWLGAMEYHNKINSTANLVFLETAHPAKFPETIDMYLGSSGQLPGQLLKISEKKEQYYTLENDYQQLKGLISEL